MRWAGVVVAGGGSRRFGADKLAAPLPAGGDQDPVPLLTATTRAALSVSPAAVLPLVVVGPDRSGLVDDVRLRFTTEDPPGSGPAAAVLAGLAVLPEAEVVVVLPGDAPFAAEAVPRLLAALRDGEPAGTRAAVAVDDAGRRQHLLLAVHREALAGVRLGGPGAPARALLADLPVVEVPVTAREALDVDDPAALDRAAQLLGRRRSPDGRPGRLFPGSSH